MAGTILEANHEGTKLKEYEGNDKNLMTIHGELNKLAANVAMAATWEAYTTEAITSNLQS